MQPLFPGESGVDQLVEIIKVEVIYYFNLYLLFSLWCILLAFLYVALFCFRYWARQPERKLSAWIQIILNSSFRRSKLTHGIRFVRNTIWRMSLWVSDPSSSPMGTRLSQHSKLMIFCFLDISQENTIWSSGSCVEAAPVFTISALHCCKNFQLCLSNTISISFYNCS